MGHSSAWGPQGLFPRQGKRSLMPGWPLGAGTISFALTRNWDPTRLAAANLGRDVGEGSREVLCVRRWGLPGCGRSSWWRHCG